MVTDQITIQKDKQQTDNEWNIQCDWVNCWIFHLLRIITWNWSASNERIASISVRASANRLVIVNIASGQRWTNANTRIYATFIQTCQISWTFRRGDTFRPTIWSTSNVIWQTWTYGRFADFTTLWIRTARRGHTTNNRCYWNNWMT